MQDNDSGFVHWIVFDILPTGSNLEIFEGEPLSGKKGKNDFGHSYYEGPCPQNGKHEYSFRIYALDKKLDLDESAPRKDIENAMENHVIDTATITGKYKKQAFN